MMQTTQQGWIIQWFNEQKRDKWKIGTPQFKYCKKRKDQYTSQFPLGCFSLLKIIFNNLIVWYKAPYKYHCHLEVENMSPDENVISYIDLNYEDGQKIIDAKHGSAISKNENYFIHHHIQTSSPLIRKFKSEVTLGPFQFNICSYKQDGRKFRMLIFLYVPFILGGIPQQPGVQTICCLISPPFIIRAKKPIVQPGIKKTVAKRKKQDETNQPKKKKRSKSPKKKNQEEVKKSLQQPTTSLIQSQQPIITSQMIEDFLDDFDNVEDNVENQPTLQPQFLSQPVQQLNVPQQNDPLESLLENDEDKVVELFKQLDQTRRKNLLTQLIEESFAHEKEFLFKYNNFL